MKPYLRKRRRFGAASNATRLQLEPFGYESTNHSTPAAMGASWGSHDAQGSSGRTIELFSATICYGVEVIDDILSAGGAAPVRSSNRNIVSPGHVIISSHHQRRLRSSDLGEADILLGYP